MNVYFKREMIGGHFRNFVEVRAEAESYEPVVTWLRDAGFDIRRLPGHRVLIMPPQHGGE